MVAKPDKGKQVEAMLCQMAQTGQLGGKLGDEELKGLLDRMSGRVVTKNLLTLLHITVGLQKKTNLKYTILGREPESIIHYTRPGYSIKQPHPELRNYAMPCK